MIPYRDENPTSSRAWVTGLLIVANAAVFLHMQMGAHFDAQLCYWGLIPARVTGAVTHWSKAGLCRPPFAPAHLTLLTHMFVHGGWLHLGGNMLFLWIFGNNIEDALGHFRFIVFYFVCGLTAVFFQILADPTSVVPMVGASGAIAGVLGADVILFPTAWVHVLLPIFVFLWPVRIPAVLLLLFWFAMQVLAGLVSARMHLAGGVAWYAHVGGFVAGVLLILLIPKRAGWRRLRRPVR